MGNSHVILNSSSSKSKQYNALQKQNSSEGGSQSIGEGNSIEQLTSESLLHSIQACTGPIIKYVPSSARSCVAEALHVVINNIVKYNDLASWVKLFVFPNACLRSPPKKRKDFSLATIVKKQTTDFMLLKDAQEILDKCRFHQIIRNKSKTNKQNIAKLVSSKLDEGDVKGAIRIATSDNSIILPSATS